MTIVWSAKSGKPGPAPLPKGLELHINSKRDGHLRPREPPTWWAAAASDDPKGPQIPKFAEIDVIIDALVSPDDTAAERGCMLLEVMCRESIARDVLWRHPRWLNDGALVLQSLVTDESEARSVGVLPALRLLLGDVEGQRRMLACGRTQPPRIVHALAMLLLSALPPAVLLNAAESLRSLLASTFFGAVVLSRETHMVVVRALVRGLFQPLPGEPGAEEDDKAIAEAAAASVLPLGALPGGGGAAARPILAEVCLSTLKLIIENMCAEVIRVEQGIRVHQPLDLRNALVMNVRLPTQAEEAAKRACDVLALLHVSPGAETEEEAETLSGEPLPVDATVLFGGIERVLRSARGRPLSRVNAHLERAAEVVRALLAPASVRQCIGRGSPSQLRATMACLAFMMDLPDSQEHKQFAAGAARDMLSVTEGAASFRGLFPDPTVGWVLVALGRLMLPQESPVLLTANDHEFVLHRGRLFDHSLSQSMAASAASISGRFEPEEPWRRDGAYAKYASSAGEAEAATQRRAAEALAAAFAGENDVLVEMLATGRQHGEAPRQESVFDGVVAWFSGAHPDPSLANKLDPAEMAILLKGLENTMARPAFADPAGLLATEVMLCWLVSEAGLDLLLGPEGAGAAAVPMMSRLLVRLMHFLDAERTPPQVQRALAATRELVASEHGIAALRTLEPVSMQGIVQRLRLLAVGAASPAHSAGAHVAKQIMQTLILSPELMQSLRD